MCRDLWRFGPTRASSPTIRKHLPRLVYKVHNGYPYVFKVCRSSRQLFSAFNIVSSRPDGQGLNPYIQRHLWQSLVQLLYLVSINLVFQILRANCPALSPLPFNTSVAGAEQPTSRGGWREKTPAQLKTFKSYLVQLQHLGQIGLIFRLLGRTLLPSHLIPFNVVVAGVHEPSFEVGGVKRLRVIIQVPA